MSWSGTMTCNLINKTGGTITDVTFTHQWNEGVDEPLLNQPIADGDVIPVPIHVGEGGTDLWSVRFTDADGNCWYWNEKQCNVEKEDFDSGKPVDVVLKPGKVGFSVETPVSEPCPDNYYDSCNE
ncbi:MAG: hypothetical protein ACLGH0_15695 [Thermoanaerobaculia bacterium]